MKKMAIVYFILGLAVVIYMMLGCGISILNFINIPSIIVTLGLGFLISLASHGPGDFFGAYRTAWQEAAGTDTAEMKKAYEIIRGFGANLMMSGFIGFLFGFVTIIAFYMDSDSFGSGLSLSLLTVIYAMVFVILLVYPYTHYLKGQIAGRE